MKSFLLFGALAALSLAQTVDTNCECEPMRCPLNRFGENTAYCQCFHRSANECAKKCGRPVAVLDECRNVPIVSNTTTSSGSTLDTTVSTRMPIPVTTSPLPVGPVTQTPDPATPTTSDLQTVPSAKNCRCKRQACPFGNVLRFCKCQEEARLSCWNDCGGPKPEPTMCGDGFMPPKREAILPLPTKRAEPRQLMGIPECSATKPCALGYTCAHKDCAYGMVNSAECGAKCVLDPALSLFPPVSGGLADLIADLASLGKRSVPRQIMSAPECSEEDPCDEGSVCLQMSGTDCRYGMIDSENCGAQCVPDPVGALSSTFGLGSLSSSISVGSKKLRHRQIMSEPECSSEEPCAEGLVCAQMRSMDCRYGQVNSAQCGAKCIPDPVASIASLPSTLTFSLGSSGSSLGSLSSSLGSSSSSLGSLSSSISIGSKERRQIMSAPECNADNPCEAGLICAQLNTAECRYGQIDAANCGSRCIPDVMAQPAIFSLGSSVSSMGSLASSLGSSSSSLGSLSSSVSIGSKERRQIMSEPECSDENPCAEGLICVQMDTQDCRYGQITAENCGAQCVPDVLAAQPSTLSFGSSTSSVSIGSKERRQIMSEPVCSDENPCADGLICVQMDTQDCRYGEVTAENCGAQCVADPAAAMAALSSTFELGSLSSSVSIGSKERRQIMSEPICSDENPCAEGLICVQMDTLDCRYGQVSAENCGAQCIPDPAAAVAALSSTFGLGSLSSSVSIGSKERRQIMTDNECGPDKPCADGLLCVQLSGADCRYGEISSLNCGAKCMADPGSVVPIESPKIPIPIPLNTSTTTSSTSTISSTSTTTTTPFGTYTALPDPAALTTETTTTTTTSQNLASALPAPTPSPSSDPPTIQSTRQKPAPQKCEIPGANRDAKLADSPCPTSQRCFNPASRQVTDANAEGWCTGMTCGGEMQMQCPQGQVCVGVPRGLASVTPGASRGICAFEEMACRVGHDEDCAGEAFGCAAVIGKEGEAEGACALKPS